MSVQRLFMLLSLVTLCVDIKADFDFSNLIPWKWPMNLARVLTRSVSDKETGIWFVRKPLADSGVGLTIDSTSVGLYHFGIVINGKLYHVQTSSKQKYMRIEKINMYESLADSFTWYKAMDGKKNLRSRWQLDEYASRYESENEYGVVPIGDGVINCQTFVKEMYSYATGSSKSYATIIINLSVGLIIF